MIAGGNLQNEGFHTFEGVATPFLPQHYTVDYKLLLFEKFKFVSHKVLELKKRMGSQKQDQHKIVGDVRAQ